MRPRPLRGRALTGGKRRNTNGAADPTGSLEASGLPNRGFTDHEHIEELGLLHMNGRLYDPLIARFISADPIIADPLSVQAFNRYSYVDNNPLTYTDPTGYLKLGRVLRTVVAIAVAVVIMQPQLGIVAALGKFGASVLAGTVAGAISTGTVQGALMGGLSAGLFYAVGPIAAGFGKAASIARVGLSGTVGGMMSVMQGGKFGSGFLAAGFTATISPGLEKIGDIAARTAVAAIAGGVASVIGGCKFENGAITGAFQALFAGLAEGSGGHGYSRDDSGKISLGGQLITDVDGVIVIGNAAAYREARDYLRADPSMAKIIADLEKGGSLNIYTNSNEVNSYNPHNNSIKWDPTSAARLSSGDTVSPALILGHELGHAASPRLGMFLGMFPHRDFTNLEEYRVIKFIENPAARILGEGIRMDHKQVQFFKVKGPTNR